MSPSDGHAAGRDPEAAAPKRAQGAELVPASDAPASDTPIAAAREPDSGPAPAPPPAAAATPASASAPPSAPAPEAAAPHTAEPTVGWFGKLPALGDFASRRLDPQAVQAWDACLSEGIEACRAAWGEAWLDHYLGAPVCCFVQGEDLEDGDPPAAGVLMPSVDRAGRYFPLLLVQPLPALPPGDAGWRALQLHLDRLVEVALGVLQPGQGVETLESALRALGGVPNEAAPTVDPAAEPPLDLAAPPATPHTGTDLLTALLRDHSLWWHGAPNAGIWTRLDARWPTPATFTAWLGAA